MQADQPGIDLSKVSVREAADRIARQMAAFRRASGPQAPASDAAPDTARAGPLRLDPPQEPERNVARRPAPLTAQAEDRIAPPIRPRRRAPAAVTLLALTALAGGGAWLAAEQFGLLPSPPATPIAADAARGEEAAPAKTDDLAAAPAIAPRLAPRAGPVPRAEARIAAAIESFAPPEPPAAKTAAAAAALEPELKPGATPPATEQPPQQAAVPAAPDALPPAASAALPTIAPAEAALEQVPVNAPPSPPATVRNLATKPPQPKPPAAKPFIPTARPFVPEPAQDAAPEAEPFQPQPKPFQPAAQPFDPAPRPFVPSGEYTTAP